MHCERQVAPSRAEHAKAGIRRLELPLILRMRRKMLCQDNFSGGKTDNPYVSGTNQSAPDERPGRHQSRSSSSNPDELPDVITVPELAAFLRVSEKSVYTLVSGRRIPHMKVLRCVRFLKADVLRYLQENRVSASEE